MNLKPGLYIVSTPIGNLSDITLRALEVLKNSDIIFCEDSRVSHKLLTKYSITTSLNVYNDNSDEYARDQIKKLIQCGKAVSLISDAGTPLISDPGYKLVRDLKNKDMHVDVIPGPCALIAALTISGLATDKFLFAGFLPKTQESKTKAFSAILDADYTTIFYETAPRIVSSLQIAYDVLGDRTANISRELTKLYQESKSDNLSNLITHFQKHNPKGEIVFTIEGKQHIDISQLEIEHEVSLLLQQGNTAKTASDIIFGKYKNQMSRKEIYQLVNTLKKTQV